MNGFVNEKESLPVPVAAVQPEGISFARKLFRFFALFFAAFLIIDAFTEDPQIAPRGAHGCMHRSFDHDHQSPHHHGHGKGEHKWINFNGTEHFELDPRKTSGLTIKGVNAFGKVLFETSKTSDKITIDLDIKLSHKTQEEDVTAIEKDGHITVSAPETGNVKVLANAKIMIPSNIIGKFGLPSFELDVINHMVDYSSLPQSLEIGDFNIKVASGSIHSGNVNTNTTTLDIATGNLTGKLTLARGETSIKIASGNATLYATSISSGNGGELNMKLANGDLKGHYAVYNSSTFDVAIGNIHITVDIEEGKEEAALNTKAGSGNTKILVKNIKKNRKIEAYHTAVAGDHLITYPDTFEGTISARSLVGEITMAGDGLEVSKQLLGQEGVKGDKDHDHVYIKTAKGDIDVLVGDDEKLLWIAI